MVTPFGSVFNQPSIPSGMESYAYFQQQKQQKLALEQQKKLAEQKARQEADQELVKFVKPLQELKTTTGFTDRAPEAYMTAQVQEAQKKATEMYRAGRPASEVSAYIQNTVRGVDGMRNWLTNSQAALEQQIATLSKDSGLDPAKLRELGTTELLYVDDGKGGKRLRTPDEMSDVTNILPAILEKHADKINVTDRDKLYDLPADAEHRNDYKSVMTFDGRKVYGTASGKYNSIYQEVTRDMDNDIVYVKTKGLPLFKGDEPVLGPDGEEIIVLPTEAYRHFISNPGRMVELGKEVKKKKAELMQRYEFEAGQKASEELNYRYGLKLKDMPAAKRLKMKDDLKKQYLETMDIPDDEVIRQQAAYELADKNIRKGNINVNELRDPAKITINSGGGSSRGSGTKPDVDYNDVYSRIKSAIENFKPNGGFMFDPGGKFTGQKKVPMTQADVPTEVMTHFMAQAKMLKPQEKFDVDQMFFEMDDNGNLFVTEPEFSGLKMPINDFFTNVKFNNTVAQRKEISEDTKKKQGSTPAPAPFIFPGGKNKF